MKHYVQFKILEDDFSFFYFFSATNDTHLNKVPIILPEKAKVRQEKSKFSC